MSTIAIDAPNTPQTREYKRLVLEYNLIKDKESPRAKILYARMVAGMAKMKDNDVLTIVR
jgi:hypothetical protein